MPCPIPNPCFPNDEVHEEALERALKAFQRETTSANLALGNRRNTTYIFREGSDTWYFYQGTHERATRLTITFEPYDGLYASDGSFTTREPRVKLRVDVGVFCENEHFHVTRAGEPFYIPATLWTFLRRHAIRGHAHPFHDGGFRAEKCREFSDIAERVEREFGNGAHQPTHPPVPQNVRMQRAHEAVRKNTNARIM